MSISRSIGGYRLIAGLGAGGMARVYLAMAKKQSGFTKLLVLKVLRSELDDLGDYLTMFMEEARLAARLNHPNVVQTYEVGEDGENHFLAMEYLEGQPLSALVARLGPGGIPRSVHLRVLCDVLEGLHYAHELTDYDGTPLCIVHRDVSPQNVFVTYTGQAKVLDFGIAKIAGSNRTQSGVLKGKVGYMAPEQGACKALDRRADVFAVGVMLWEALAGRRLVNLRTDDDIAVLHRRINGEDPRIRDVAPDTPAEIADICDRAMATDPDARFATAAEMRDAIERYLKSVEPADARSISALLEAHFAEERTGIRRLVDEQLKSADDTGPLIDLRTGRAITISSPNIPGVTETTSPTVTFPSDRSPNTLAMSVESGRPPRPGPLKVALAAATLLVAGAAGAWRATREHSASASSPSSTSVPASPVAPRGEASVAVAAAAAVESPPAATVTIAIRATPPTATLLLDGEPIPNPHRLEPPRDGSRHTLEIAAPGHASQQRPVVYDRDDDIAITLARAVPASPTSTPGTPGKNRDRPRDQRPRRAVDDEDPY